MSKSSSSTATIASLPTEIMAKIFGMLSTPDKCQCTLVCKDWRDKLRTKLAWPNVTFTWTPEKDLAEGSPTLDILIQCGIRHLAIKSFGKRSTLSFSIRPLPWERLIQFLSQVESLYIDYTCIKYHVFCQSAIWLALPQLTKLTCVDFDSTINGSVEDITRNLTNLVSLEFNRRTARLLVMTDDSLLHIARNLSKLTHLTIDCNGVTDFGIAHLTHYAEETNHKVAQLQYLSLGGCKQLTDTSMYYLSVGQPNLKYLCIADTEKVTNIGVACLRKLKHLQELVYLPRSTIIADNELDDLALLRQLSVLRFRCRKKRLMTEFQQLATMDNLHVLELHNFDSIGKEVWSSFGSMPHLRELSLYDSLVSEENLNALADAESRLVKLEIIGSYVGMTDKGFQNIARLAHLRELTLFNCRNIRGTGLAYLATGLAKITTFKLGIFNDSIPYSALVQIARYNHLRTLTWFGNNAAAVNEHIDSFKRNRPDVNFQLKQLELFKIDLMQELPHLKFLRIYM